MFIRYQKVRNVVVGSALAVAAGVAVVGMNDGKASKPHNEHAVAMHEAEAAASRETPRAITSTASSPTHQHAEAEQVPTQDSFEPVVQTPVPRAPEKKPISKQERYAQALAIALAPASSDKGKDVLGPRSPWKLNLYDDDGDGQWDRGKLDTNRDEEDDEKWNFKGGRWEKDDGKTIWQDGHWVAIAQRNINASGQQEPHEQQPQQTVDATLARYRAAMKIATSRAAGKGKDVLGPGSPWKLNLYDDDGDGQWDRGKLDTNRDEEDDEKWNFKKGRWEKDGGKTIWQDDHWQPAE